MGPRSYSTAFIYSSLGFFFCSLLSAFLSRSSMFLTFPKSWILHCNLGFTLTTSHMSWALFSKQSFAFVIFESEKGRVLYVPSSHFSYSFFLTLFFLAINISSAPFLQASTMWDYYYVTVLPEILSGLILKKCNCEKSLSIKS